MDKKTLSIVIVLAIILLSALGYVYYSNNNTNQTSEILVASPANDMEDEMVNNEQPINEAPGKYTEYSQEAVLGTSGTKLLFFHAPWCPQCRSIEASIEQEGLPKNVTVFKVDYDSNQELRQKYGVTIQTTFVKVDDSGNKIESYVAYQEPTFDSVERELLQ